MEIISECDLSVERLESLFIANGHTARIVEIYPATQEWELSRDIYLEVIYPENIVLIIWINSRIALTLRMRVVLIPSSEMKNLDTLSKALLYGTVDLKNQNVSCFGTLTAKNLHGLTLEYALGYQHGILGTTILVAARHVVDGALNALNLLTG